MNSRVPRSLGWWLGGTTLAGSGVVLARVVAPRLQTGSALWTIVGHLLALAGLLVIAVGVRRKYEDRLDA